VAGSDELSGLRLGQGSFDVVGRGVPAGVVADLGEQVGCLDLALTGGDVDDDRGDGGGQLASRCSSRSG
jgi:hypothetical protein